MAEYKKSEYRRSSFPKRVGGVLLLLILISLVGVLITRSIYNNDLKPVNDSPKTQVFEVKSGSSVKKISETLQQSNLIRSAWAFQLYVHSKVLTDKLQAGMYALSPNEGTVQIVDILTKGRISAALVTIVPGQRIDQIRANFINDGFKPAEVDSAINDLGQYSDLPVMTYKPTSVTTLEGLLWPDSWYKDSSTPPSYIIRESLAEMGHHLTPDIQAAFASENLTVYQGLTLTSIVEKEVNKPSDQITVAQVFLSRLKSNSSLGSDVTANYGSVIAGHSPSLKYDSPYNTLIHNGLPPTPISTINTSSLYASTHPSATNWLYFVTGDDGTTYFSNTLQEQQSNTSKYCHKLCSQ